MMSDLTLDKAYRQARQSEQIKGQISKYSGAIALCEVTHSSELTLCSQKVAFKPERRDHCGSYWSPAQQHWKVLEVWQAACQE